jgi:8-oxo-dGTP pyrophosphatase MutT (NUDIX family)
MDKQVFTAAGADMGAGTVSGEGLRAWIKEAHERKNRSYPKGSSAVLIPFLIRDGAYHVLYEVRSAKLRSQPGEICFPGGRIEAGESPVETAVREATEELCIDRSRIEIVGVLDDTIGPGAIPLFTYIAILHDYEGTWSHAEVDRVFTVPLEWILTHDPDIYRIRLARQMPEDFPYEYVPGGRDYRWRDQYYSVPFYPQLPTERSLFKMPEEKKHPAEMRDSGPVPTLWGVTARVSYALSVLLREGRENFS